MKNIFKRIGAYAIDMVIITLLVTLLTSIDKINFQYHNSQKYNKEYTKITEKYTSVISKQSKLEKKYQNKKIKRKKYQEQKKEYKVQEKKYEKKLKVLQYNISRNSVIYYIVYIAFILGYFGIFQSSFNGQTLGKKLMHLKVVNKDDTEAPIWKLLLRSFILYNVWMYPVILILAFNLNSSSFYTSSLIINEVARGIQLLILLMVIINKNNLGLHDYLLKTKVICTDIEQTEEVLEAEVVEEKETKKKEKKKGDK